MEVFDLFGSFGSSALGYILPFLFVLTIVVFFHELGHFLVGRWCGVGISTFSVGFGPELLGFTDRQGTRWKLSAIPLGGYVKFLGDENEAGGTDRAAIEQMDAEQRGRAFASKSVAARAAIVAAGPFANFLLAVVIFTAIFSIYGRQVTEARVDAVVAESAASRAGFQQGDIVRSINGETIDSFADLQRIVSVNADNPLSITVERDGSMIPLTATPERREVTDQFGNQQRVGILGISRSTTPENVRTERYSVPEAAALAVGETWFVIERTMVYLGQVITGRESADQLGGPIRVAEISGQVATIGFVALINLAAVLSISIGLINLFPIPMLDGGHLVFYALEALRGRPLSDRTLDISFRIGFAVMIMLMIFATWNDIIHLSLL